MPRNRQYNYGKTFANKPTVLTKVCKRCEQAFTYTSVGGGRSRKYCFPCAPLAERERHRRSEIARRARATANGHLRSNNYKKPKLIPYAGYDDGVVE